MVTKFDYSITVMKDRELCCLVLLMNLVIILNNGYLNRYESRSKKYFISQHSLVIAAL